MTLKQSLKAEWKLVHKEQRKRVQLGGENRCDGPEARARHIQGTENIKSRVSRLVKKKGETEGEVGRARSHSSRSCQAKDALNAKHNEKLLKYLEKESDVI